MYKNMHEEEFYACLDGDLCQMVAQETFLQRHGIRTRRVDVYPTLKTKEEYEAAIQLLQTYKVEGYWNYPHCGFKIGDTVSWKDENQEKHHGVVVAKPKNYYWLTVETNGVKKDIQTEVLTNETRRT